MVLPFARYSPATSARRAHNVMLCHSVFSSHSPPLFLNFSLVAREKLATAVPAAVYLTSGSFPKLPIKMTLFKLAITLSPLFFSSLKEDAIPPFGR